jgi:hypothetical protein
MVSIKIVDRDSDPRWQGRRSRRPRDLTRRSCGEAGDTPD